MRPSHTLALPIVLALALACGRGEGTVERSSQPARASGRTLVLGKISQDPFDEIREWQPLADYLAGQLEGFSIGRVETRVFPRSEAMGTALAAGEVDLFFDNPFSGALASSAPGTEYLLSRIKSGEARKHSVFFARAGSGIGSVAELRGRMLALEDPESSSGYLLPYVHLLEVGLRPVEKPDPRSPVSPDEVGMVFTGDDRNTVAWVLRGRVVAGAVDNETLESFARSSPDQLVAFAATEPITRNQPGLVSATVTAELREALRRLLVELPADVTLPPGTRGFAYVEDDRSTLERLRGVLGAIEAGGESGSGGAGDGAPGG